MPYNGFYFVPEKGVPTGVVAQRMKLCVKGGATGYPAVQGLGSTLGRTVGAVELCQLGLAVRFCREHLMSCYGWICFTNVTIIYLLCKFFVIYSDKFGQKRTSADKYGHSSWLWLYLCIVNPENTEPSLSSRRPKGGRISTAYTWMYTRFFTSLRYVLNDKC